jgi:hypothetical protein
MKLKMFEAFRDFSVQSTEKSMLKYKARKHYERKVWALYLSKLRDYKNYRLVKELRSNGIRKEYNHRFKRVILAKLRGIC